MQFYSVWPAFAGTAILFAIAATPLFRAADTPPTAQKNRLKTLDGLRGFLAFAVYFHHVATYHLFLQTGYWGTPPSHFYEGLGPLGVQLFFMITGYLFWSRLVRQEGRPGWVSLYLGRIFRIGPLYLVAFLFVALVGLERTGFALRVRPLSLVGELAVCLLLGLKNMIPVNGYNTSLLLDNVTWTLQKEWFFYLSLPIFAQAAKRRGLQLPFTVGALLCCVVVMRTVTSIDRIHGGAILLSLFLMGMLSASLGHRGLRMAVPDWMTSTAVCLMLGSVFFFRDFYQVLPMLLTGASFYLITCGCSLFGLLLSRPARRLGDISYGIYLLQGIPQALLFRTPFFKAVALASPAGHWLVALLAGVLLLLMALLAHVAVELPGVSLGKRVWGAVSRAWLRQRPLRVAAG